jgi:hypothetical protein
MLSSIIFSGNYVLKAPKHAFKNTLKSIEIRWDVNKKLGYWLLISVYQLVVNTHQSI